MSRASERRKAKEEKRKKAVYNVTKEQLDELVKQELEENLEEYQSELYSEAVRDSFILMMSFSLKVLKEHYWKKSFPERVGGFCNRVLNLYAEWGDGKTEIEEIEKELWEEGGIKLDKRD